MAETRPVTRIAETEFLISSDSQEGTMLILNSAENTEAAVVAVTYVEEIRPFADEIQILTKSRIYKITGVADVDVTRAALQAIIWPTI